MILMILIFFYIYYTFVINKFIKNTTINIIKIKSIKTTNIKSIKTTNTNITNIIKANIY